MKLKNYLSWENYSTLFTISFQTFYLIVTFVVVTSCNTRKTELNKEISNRDTLATTISEVKIKVDSNYAFDFSAFKIIPIDLSKPIIFNDNVIENATLEATRKKESGRLIKKSAEKKKETRKGSAKKAKKAKKVQKSNYTLLYGFMFFIACSFIFLWFYLPKIKKP